MARIALFTSDLECGGAQRVLLQLAREFVSMGQKVDLIVARPSSVLLTQLPVEARLFTLSAGSSASSQIGLGIASLWRLCRYLRVEQPAALLSTIAGANLVAAIARLLVAREVRLVLREAASVINRPRSRWASLARLLYGTADSVVVLSSAMHAHVLALPGILPERVICIPNGVDRKLLEMLAAMPIQSERFDSNWPFVLSVGRLTAEKDHSSLIRAFAKLDRVDLRLVILGDGPERVALESLVRDLAVEDRVLMPGFDANPWRWMRRAQLFVLSSISEGQPSALLEALTLRVPVVCTAYDASAAEIVGTGGLIVPPGNVELLASAIRAALEHPPAARERDCWSVRDAATRYLELLLPKSESRI